MSLRRVLCAAVVLACAGSVLTAARPSDAWGCHPGGGAGCGPPENTKLPQISGTASNGQTLTVIPGTWTGGTLTYQWVRCGSLILCEDIPGANGSTFEAGDEEIDAEIKVREIACFDLDHCGTATSTGTSAVGGAELNGYAASDTATDNQNLGTRYLCQNLGPNPSSATDPRNGCRNLRPNFQNCCGGEPLYGTRSDLKAPSFGWTIPADDHFGGQRVAAEGGYESAPNFLEKTLLQGGVARVSQGDALDEDPFCNTDSGLKRRFVERGWNTPASGGWVFECQFFGTVAAGEHFIVRVSNRDTADGNDWSVYFDGVQTYNHEDSMTRASLIYVGGEYTNRRTCGLVECEEVQTGCIGAGFGVDGGLQWQRARAPAFGDPFTVQSSFKKNEKGKWFIGDVPDGFWIQNTGENCS